MRHMARIKKKPKLNTFMLHSKSTYFYKQQWNSYLVPAMCALALLLGFGFAINPFAHGEGRERAYAAINEDLGDGASISLSISNGGSEVADDGAVSTQVKPGEVAYISNDITINTTKIKRYYVGVQSAGADSSLTGESSQAKIAGVGENVYPVNFGDNTWGYALVGDTTSSETTLQYNTLPAYNDNAPVQYQSKDNPTNGTYKMRLIFAANIRADKPADHYKNTALVSVAAEARDMLWADYGLTTMQGMTSDICKNAEVGTTGQLKDTRDQKLYWATKLADGNCWMTQNLDLDIPAEGLKAADTDIAADWNSSSAVPPVATKTTVEGFNTVIASYDPGEKYCNNTGCELTASTNGGHDAVGNYYNWTTAIAGEYGPDHLPSISSTDSFDATQSICPRGWELLTIEKARSLLAIYKIAETPAWDDPKYNNVTILRESPIYLLDSIGSYSAAGKKKTEFGYLVSEEAYFENEENKYPFSVSYLTYSVKFNFGMAGNGANSNALLSVRCVAR